MRQIIVAVVLALACSVNAESITGQVVGVADGDTITVLDASGDAQDNAGHWISIGVDKCRGFRNSDIIKLT